MGVPPGAGLQQVKGGGPSPRQQQIPSPPGGAFLSEGGEGTSPCPKDLGGQDTCDAPQGRGGWVCVCPVTSSGCPHIP